MQNEFLMDLKDIQPSQLYISSKKLENVRKWFKPNKLSSYDAIPIKRLNGRIVFTDGHTRAFAAYLEKAEKIKVYWDEDELDWDAYQICVDWCLEEGIQSIMDLQDRVIPANVYDDLWLKRCQKLHEQLENR